MLRHCVHVHACMHSGRNLPGAGTRTHQSRISGNFSLCEQNFQAGLRRPLRKHVLTTLSQTKSSEKKTWGIPVRNTWKFCRKLALPLLQLCSLQSRSNFGVFVHSASAFSRRTMPLEQQWENFDSESKFLFSQWQHNTIFETSFRFIHWRCDHSHCRKYCVQNVPVPAKSLRGSRKNKNSRLAERETTCNRHTALCQTFKTAPRLHAALQFKDADLLFWMILRGEKFSEDMPPPCPWKGAVCLLQVVSLSAKWEFWGPQFLIFMEIEQAHFERCVFIWQLFSSHFPSRLKTQRGMLDKGWHTVLLKSNTKHECTILLTF